MDLKDATLLVVDDEPLLLKIFAKWFTQQAHAVLCAENGAEALTILESHKVDVIITEPVRKSASCCRVQHDPAC
jgi:CheY-like chemotaxis protein